MTNLDLRMTERERGILSKLIGRTFDFYQCDEFHFRPAVYQVVYVGIGGGCFALRNQARVVDYFGSEEEVGVLSVEPVNDDSITSYVEGGVQVRTPISLKITDIKLVDDFYEMEGAKRQKISFTKAVVFELGDRKIVLEKDVWFSEDIFVYRGHAVEGKIAAVNDDLPEGFDGFSFAGARSVSSLKPYSC